MRKQNKISAFVFAIPLLPKSEILSLNPSSVAVQPGLGQPGNPENRFSRNEAHIMLPYTVNDQKRVE